MDADRQVTQFIEENDLETDPTYRLLDLVSEVGEVAKNVNTSTSYGSAPEAATIETDELGDVLFAVYALAYETGIDPATALSSAIDKYRKRLDDGDSPSSG